MTDSQFDPTNPDAARTPRGGLDRYLAPEAVRTSKLKPGKLTDGKVEEDQPEDNNLSHEAAPPDQAAQRLEQMQKGESASGDTER